MFEKVAVGDNFPEKFNAVIEIPEGSHNKYEYDEKMGIFKLDRVIHSPFYYPADYGFIPQTLSEDGDTLDALILSTDPISTGIVVEARTVGIFKMEDEKGIDYKILGVVEEEPRLSQIQSLNDVPEHILKEIAHFFEVYKALEKKHSKVLGWGAKEEAIEYLKKSHQKWLANKK